MTMRMGAVVRTAFELTKLLSVGAAVKAGV